MASVIRRFFLSQMVPEGSSFNAVVSTWLIRCRELAADGLTLAEIGELFVEFLQLCVEAATHLANPGTEKKQLVLDAVGMFVDVVGPLLLTKLWLGWASWLLLPSLKSFVLSMADGAIEAIYRRLQRE